jgi:hypothetical protein
MWWVLVVIFVGAGLVGDIDYQYECGQSAECSAK